MMLRLLRFFNVLEPGKPVLSITKIAMWQALFHTSATIGVALWGYVIDRPPLDTTAILANAVNLFGVGSLYSWRRWVAYKTGNAGLFPDVGIDGTAGYTGYTGLGANFRAPFADDFTRGMLP